MRQIPSDSTIMEHVIRIDCRVKGNCVVNDKITTVKEAKEYCKRCTHNRNGSKMQDYYLPKLKDLHYL